MSIDHSAEVIIQTLENLESSRTSTESVTLTTKLMIAKFRVEVLELQHENACLKQENSVLREHAKETKERCNGGVNTTVNDAVI